LTQKKKMNSEELNSALKRTKENVKRQAALALIAIVTTVVMCFALTVAWYSNILHTSDLMFQAKSWDFVFEGSLTMSDGNILAAPGDSGTITLSLANVSDEANRLASPTNVSAIGVNVNIDKSSMGIMKPRIFFYVDKQITKNEETVDRIYLSSTDSYLYTVYPGHTLQISETYSNDYPIKWEWVYDVVGYYVKGTMDEEKKFTSYEYLKPIVYDPNQAVYDESHHLVSINGQSVQDFITTQYLSKDGYPGSEFVVVEGTNYIVVNETEGVYIYLCTKEEIDNANLVDTALGTTQSEQPATYSARIILTGQKANENAVDVSSSEDLLHALQSGNGVIQLINSMEIAEAVTIPSGSNVVLDLNGHTLTLTDTINTASGSSLGLIDGTITTQKEKQVLINAVSSEIYMDNLIVEGFYSGIEVHDEDSTEDSHIYVSQCQITTADSVVWLRGNGEKSARKATLIVENSTLASEDYIPIGGNGSADRYGTDIQVLSSTLTGKYAAIFHPMSQSSLFVKNSTLIADVGLAVKGGKVTVENSTLQGIGLDEGAAYNNSGFSNTGDALYIEDNYAVNVNETIQVTIKGEDTHLISHHGDALQVYQPDSTHVSVVVYDGTYSSDVGDYLPVDESKIIKKLTDTEYQVIDKPASEPSEAE